MQDLTFRSARRTDLRALVRLLADDPLGARREADVDPLPESYWQAFDAIARDPNHALIVAEAPDGAIAGVLQLSFLPGLTHQGAWRAQIEGVRVASALRSGGMGQRLFEHAIERARQRGCRLVQLTSDKTRPDAIRFYARLGFVASHEGLKLRLDLDPA